MGTITKTCLMHRTRSNRSVCLNILNKRSIWNKLVRPKRGSCYRRSIMMFEPVQYCGLLIGVTIRVYHRVSQTSCVIGQIGIPIGIDMVCLFAMRAVQSCVIAKEIQF
jgi:hypothetical protein